MSSFIIKGNAKLKGNIQPQGAKNEALQVLCATLLSKEKIIISNIPDIIDVNVLIKLLKYIGVKVTKINNTKYSFEAKNIKIENFGSKKYNELANKIRGSIMLLGPMLGRFGIAKIYKPGGDKIGRRRLDTHFKGIESLGAKSSYNNTTKSFNFISKNLTGNNILLEEASVTGTANVIMAAILAKGETEIYNAACEPYIQQLCLMLNNMGAEISGIGSNLLIIKGVKKLKGCSHEILPDMIEIGSFIGLAAMTQSEITIKNVNYQKLGIIPETFKKLGINLKIKGDDIQVLKQKNYKIKNFIDGSILSISDAPWPGLTPDLLSIILVVATQAKGSVLIHQKMFESRLFFVDKLIEMGAKIILCDPHRATVIGLNRETSLRATIMSSPDIRAGVALLIAALSAEGTSIIHNIDQIDRGYNNIDKRLNKLGANIKRKK
tara:strand:+ start:2516 stop:3823 length:1308 start_codon:yes stop_codon:yes gene_type:complete